MEAAPPFTRPQASSGASSVLELLAVDDETAEQFLKLELYISTYALRSAYRPPPDPCARQSSIWTFFIQRAELAETQTHPPSLRVPLAEPPLNVMFSSLSCAVHETCG